MKTTANLFAAQLLGFIAGINKRLAGKKVPMLNTEYTDTQLIGIFQPYVDLAHAAMDLETQRRSTVAKAAASREAVMPIAQAFHDALLVMFRGDTEALADFSVKPHKARETSAQTKATAAARAKVTRAALGTKGSRQKKEALKKLKEQSAAALAPAPAPKQ